MVIYFCGASISAELMVNDMGLPGQAVRLKFVPPFIPLAVGNALLQGYVQTSISRTTLPIHMPFLYSLTSIAITPTSTAVGFMSMSPFAEREIVGVEEIGLLAEYPGLNVTFVEAADRGVIKEYTSESPSASYAPWL